MTLSDLKKAVDGAFERAIENEIQPDEVLVTLQIDGPTRDESVYTSQEVELHYDCDGMASGCVMTAWLDV